MKFLDKRTNHTYFKGWYFKHQSPDYSIAFIPALFVDEQGQRCAVLQIIENEKSWQIQYPIDEFKYSLNSLDIKIGNSYFSRDGIKIDIQDNQLYIQAEMTYSLNIELNRHIMGPFQFLPKMQCFHQVYSRAHFIYGDIIVNDVTHSFRGDIGYIEGDEGNSFPSHYSWMHAALNHDGYINSMMVAIAHIPYWKIQFQGITAFLCIDHKEILLATYLGAKVKKVEEHRFVIKQRNYTLEVECLKKCPVQLSAPDKGSLTRTIHENIRAMLHIRLMNKHMVIFDKIIENASYEYVNCQ